MLVRILARVWLAPTISVIASTLATSSLPAQTSSSGSGPYVVRVEPPGQGADISGIVSTSGLAVDCCSSRAATRVSVYDGEVVPSRHLGDATFNLHRELDDACVNRPGSIQMGWRFALDTRRLTPGSHTLVDVGHFASGAE